MEHNTKQANALRRGEEVILSIMTTDGLIHSFVFTKEAAQAVAAEMNQSVNMATIVEMDEIDLGIDNRRI